MSTKACVEIGRVYLYQHWDGYNLPAKVARALDRGVSRWNDEPYLARIIFSEMIKDEVEEPTGYGIQSNQPNVDIPIIHVMCEHRRVMIGKDGWYFEEFVGEFKEGKEYEL